MDEAKGSNRSRRAPLTRERIVDAAIAIVDAEGLPALNMRRLGATLGVEAMAVYKHFPNKAAILDGVVAAVLGDLAESAAEEDWRKGFRAAFRSLCVLLHAHPNALPLVVSRPSASAQLMKRLTSTRDLLLRAELPAGDVSRLLRAGLSMTVGSVWLESGGFVGELPGETPFMRAAVDTPLQTSVESSRGLARPWSSCEDLAAGIDLLLADPARR